MFNLDGDLYDEICARTELLEKSVRSEDVEIVYASLGCTTCEVFTQ